MRVRALPAHWRKEADRLRAENNAVPRMHGLAGGLDEAANELEDVLKRTTQDVTSSPLTLIELTQTALHMFHVPPAQAIKAAEDAERGGKGRISDTLSVKHMFNSEGQWYYLEARF